MSEANVAVRIEEISPVKTKLLFDVSWDDVKKEMDAVFREVSKTANIKGFRKGKVPRNILEKYYGDYVKGETITNLINRFYWDALKRHDILAVIQPEIEQNGIEKDKNFTFTATVERVPVIEPKGYTGLELEKVEEEVTEADVEARLEKLRQMFATMEDVKEERGVREGDFVTLDFTGSVDGVCREELKADNFLLEVGSKKFIPGFEEQLINAVKGETKEIRLRFPDDYHVPDIAGKDAVFTLNVKSIKEKNLPPLGSGFVENFEKYNSLDEMKEDIRKSLEEENKVKSGNYLHNLIVMELLRNNEFEVPPSYVEREFNRIMADMQIRMVADGLSKEEASKMSGRFEEQCHQRAVQTAKVVFLINSIARKESIVVEKSELEEKIMEIARQSRDYEKTVKYLEDEAIRGNMSQEILYNKVLEFVEKQSNIKIMKKNNTMIKEESK